MRYQVWLLIDASSKERGNYPVIESTLPITVPAGNETPFGKY